jgi:hypothetical protein
MTLHHQDRARTHPGLSESPDHEEESRQRLQLKRELGTMSYADQVEAARPPLPLQMLQLSTASPDTGQAGPEAVRAVAASGVKGPAGPLPYRDQIQSAFGAHDLGDVQAYQGGAAAEATAALGASAYAMGGAVAFGGAPDLHTAAHEAAHVVQQRAGVALAGGVGRAGDAYERHADAVADKVSRNESAESLLSQLPGRSESSGAAVQRLPEGEAAGPLNERQVASALAFNRGRAMPPGAWAQIAGIVGSSAAQLGDALLQKLATWQAAVGLSADGKAGNITTQWLSQQSGGEGLEAYVKSDAVLYLGINPRSRDIELTKLKGAAGAQNVIAVVGNKRQDTIMVGGQLADLTTEAGLVAFALSLKALDDGRRDELKRFLGRAPAASRDELAQLIQVLYGAETGQRLIKRVILSGHSGGWSISGEPGNDTYISFSSLKVLATVFPMAAGQVEDLMLSACNTGQRGKLGQFQEIFPNLRSIWAYVGYSPSAATGSLGHIAAWEKASRGTIDASRMDVGREGVATGSGPRDKNVAVWTRDAGGNEAYETASAEAAMDYETLRSIVQTNLVHFTTAFNDGNLNQAELNSLYTLLQNLVGNFEYRLGGDRARFEQIMKQTLYLRHWKKVTEKFMEAFGSQVRAGYGRSPVPRFAGASRSEVLGHIKAYPGTAGDSAHQLLVDYLRDLNPALIPDTWY